MPSLLLCAPWVYRNFVAGPGTSEWGTLGSQRFTFDDLASKISTLYDRSLNILHR